MTQFMSLLMGVMCFGNTLPVISSRWAKSALTVPAGCCANHWGHFLRLSPYTLNPPQHELTAGTSARAPELHTFLPPVTLK